MEEFKLFDAEFRFVSIIWDSEPINSTVLTKICLEKLGWKKSTTYSMLKRLSERGILHNNNAIVTTLVKREQVQQYESEAIIEKTFDGSLPKFITAFLENKKITNKEAEEIKRIIEEASKNE